MKYFPLVWAALMRRKPRTILTMLSIAVAFLLYGLLQGVVAAFSAGIDIAGADRLITTGKYSLTQMQPIGFANQIRGVDGVEQVAYQSWFGGIYKEERNFFAQFPSHVEPYLEIYPEVLLPADQKEALLKTRTGAVVLKRLADKYGWKVGDKIPIISTIWPKKDGSSVWEFDLVGIFDCKDGPTRAQHEYLLFHHEYFEEARAFGQGTIGWYVLRVADGANPVDVADAIDLQFENSSNQTETSTEQAFAASFAKQFGNIALIVTLILGAVFFTLLLVAGNTMSQSVRERISELAVLKTVGFGDGLLLAVVLFESVLVMLIGGLVGLGLGWLFVQGIAAQAGAMLPGIYLSPQAMLLAVVLMIAGGVLAGLFPALKARRLTIVDALGRG
jgi:putative ABC transport system permease protein